MHWVLVADLDRGDFHGLGALPGVKEGKLSIVAPPDQEVRVLGVILETEHWR